MESLTDAPDGTHLHPGQQYSSRRSPSLRSVHFINFMDTIEINNQRVRFVLWCRRTGPPHLVRTPSPRRRNHLHPPHDVGFSDTVSNVVEIVKEEKGNHRGYRPNGRYPRGTSFTNICCTIFFFLIFQSIENTFWIFHFFPLFLSKHFISVNIRWFFLYDFECVCFDLEYTKPDVFFQFKCLNLFNFYMFWDSAQS